MPLPMTLGLGLPSVDSLDKMSCRCLFCTECFLFLYPQSHLPLFRDSLLLPSCCPIILFPA